jgi:hypothetical protein
MSDVIITTRKNISTIVGNSERGDKWMRSQLCTTVHQIRSEYLEDFIIDLKKAEITYEET